jgi:hypothetical protein
MAAPQTIEGPYRVQGSKETSWEIVEIERGKPVRLRPRLVYEKEKRTSAYRRVGLMNRKWQKAQEAK